jgi:hypothetical protein
MISQIKNLFSKLKNIFSEEKELLSDVSEITEKDFNSEEFIKESEPKELKIKKVKKVATETENVNQETKPKRKPRKKNTDEN